MKMTRRNFLSTSAVAAFACGASLTAHAAGSTDENSLNFITDIFKDSPQPGEIEEATAITAEKNAEWYEKLDFSDRREFANAERGWLDNAEGKVIYAEDGKFAWDLQSYGDLNRDAPDTVNPSLWRNTQLNAKAGLFEVCDGIYQVRGFDMANATFIRTNNDITGGNSGSPMFNGKGELIGLAFDGNWDSLSSDINFDKRLARCIGVDIRYVLYLMDKWGHADRLLKEINAK